MVPLPPVVPPPPPPGLPPLPANAAGTSASARTNAATRAMRAAGVFLVTMENLLCGRDRRHPPLRLVRRLSERDAYLPLPRASEHWTIFWPAAESIGGIGLPCVGVGQGGEMPPPPKTCGRTGAEG